MAESKSIRVVYCEGERPVRVLLDRALTAEGQTVLVVKSGAGAPELLAGERFDVEVLAPAGGPEPIDALHRVDRAGAFDALVFGEPPRQVERRLLELEYGDARQSTRPIDLGDVSEILGAEEALAAGAELRRVPRGGGSVPFVCQSPRMRSALAAAERVAPSSAPVLLRGETGTGKSLLARILHDASPRADRPFVTINCSAFPETLLESELFGHERGAFTGAVGAKPGLFELAEGGTLLLDEVGETSPAMQAKLLHVLDGEEIRRVGGTTPRRVDVRMIAATHRDLEREVAERRFREDLYFRLRVFEILVPPLRERPEDLRTLVRHFLERYRVPGERAKAISPEALAQLAAHPWRGNVRELENAIQGLALLVRGPVVEGGDLALALRRDAPGTGGPPGSAAPASPPDGFSIAAAERMQIARALAHTGGRKAPAARLLGIDVKTLGSKIRLYGLSVPEPALR